MLIDFFNNTFIFNESALKLINSSKISVFATYFLLLINFVFLAYIIFELNKLFQKKKINIFTSIIIIAIYGSFSKFLGFSIYDEVIIYIIALVYLLKNKVQFSKNPHSFFLTIFLFYIIFHSLFFYKLDFSILDNLRYFRFLAVVCISIIIFIFFKKKIINYNIAFKFCFIFTLFLIVYSIFGDLFYQNFSYLRVAGDKNPISLFYDTGGSGKFIIQNFIISGSRNFTILILVSTYFIFKSTVNLKKKIIFFTSLIFLSVYNDSNSSIYVIIILSIILTFNNLNFLKILIPSLILNYVLIALLFISIHSFTPLKTDSFLVQNLNVTIKKNLKQKSIIPVDYLISYKTNITKEKIKMSEIENLNIDNSLLKYLETKNILSIIEITNQCPDLEKLNKLSIELKNELCKRAKLYIDANDQNLKIDKILLENERLGIKKYSDDVIDTIKIRRGDYYLVDGLDLTINNHALAEAITHFLGILDRDRSFFNLTFGSGINSHRNLLPISISKLIVEFKDFDRQDEMIKQNFYNANFSSYTIPSLIFEFGFILIFFILCLILSSQVLKNINFFFLITLIVSSFFINFNDSILFFLMLLFFIKNEEKT